MSIRLKVARSEKELEDVFRLRHQVYVTERGKFSQACGCSVNIVDRFDAMPSVANIVAYEGDEAIASMRINRDSEIGLPAEEYFDFSKTRRAIEEEYRESGAGEPLLVSGSMLAIHKDWRNRRNVILALFKMAAGVMLDWGATHIIGSISEETLSLYVRMGFQAVGKPEWKEEVQDSLVPILAPFALQGFEWTYGNISEKVSAFWLSTFSGQFERVLLSPGEVLFRQGDSADQAYVIDEGWVSISRTDAGGNEMILANLARGALFGELAVLDEGPRSATATAISNVGLIVLKRERLMDIIREQPEKVGELLLHFTRQVREMDDLALIHAFAPHTQRVGHALHRLWRSADTDKRNPEIRVAKIGPQQIARSARIHEEEVLRVLEVEKTRGVLDYGPRNIRFFKEPSLNDIATADVG